jgi:FkbM family methyltransferase
MPENPPPAALNLVEQCIAGAIRCLPLKHGKHRLLDRVMPRPLGAPGREVQVRMGRGTVQLPVADLVAWHLLTLRNFDPEVAEVLVAASRAGDVFWDIGANYGACSFALQQAVPGIATVAIEPQPDLAQRLLRNLKSLGAERCQVLQVGVSTSNARATLSIPHGNAGKATLHGGADAGQHPQCEVELWTAATIAERTGLGWPQLVKVDVEGHELQVLTSLAPAFAAGAPRAVVFECHAGEGAAFAAIVQLGQAGGYQCFAIQKTPFRTRLSPAGQLMAGVTDYVLVHPAALERLRPMMLRSAGASG